jgi:chitin disaccharide deacetylase
LTNGYAQQAKVDSKEGKISSFGQLFINADDWGRDRETSDRMLECMLHGTVSSVSAMVYMTDSERAASVARERCTDAGLHLNLSLPFSAPECPSALRERQRQVAAYLLKHPFARVVFHPGLVSSFEYVVRAQLEEYHRLYGAAPDRIDGHHHLHLCANVLLARLLPSGTIVRRNFSFQRGEKSLINRLYRKAVDSRLARRHRLVDFLFPLAPLDPRSRLKQIFSLAREFSVEVETHPVNADEHFFLTGGEVVRWMEMSPISPSFTLSGK